MDEFSQINQFLNRVQKHWNKIRLIIGAFLASSLLAGLILSVALFYYFQPSSAGSYIPIILILILGKYLYTNLHSKILNKIGQIFIGKRKRRMRINTEKILLPIEWP